MAGLHRSVVVSIHGDRPISTLHLNIKRSIEDVGYSTDCPYAPSHDAWAGLLSATCHAAWETSDPSIAVVPVEDPSSDSVTFSYQN